MKPPPQPLSGPRLGELERALRLVIPTVERFARSRAHWLGFDPGYASQVVQDVIGKTFEGRLRWDERVSLATHLCRAICVAMRHEQTRISRFGSFDIATRRAVDPTTSVERVAQRRRLTALVVALRELVPDDSHVQRLLDAFQLGATSRAAVMEASGLSLAEYEAARERMVRLRLDLPHHLLRGR